MTALVLERVSARYGAQCVALAAFAGLGVAGRPTGLGLALLLLGLVLVTSRDRLWTPLACALAVMPALRTAPWVVALCVLGCLSVTIFSVAGVRTWGRLFSVPGSWLMALIPGPVIALAGAGRGASSAAVRGLAAGALLVALFGSLLSAADAAFADLTGRLLPDLHDPAPNLALALFVLAATGALAYLAALPPAGAEAPAEPVVGRTEATIAVGALIALFAVFVGVQAATLFGGDAFVRRTSGLTYAQYARSGFALLLVVAALTLAVVAAAARLTRIDRRWLAALCVLVLVVLASAWHRLGLYTDAYGPTRAREFAAWSIVWLAGLFALVLARRAVPRAVITWSAVLGIAFGLSNPDARIAAATRDAAYRATLSADAGGRCVDRGGGLLSLTLPEIQRPC